MPDKPRLRSIVGRKTEVINREERELEPPHPEQADGDGRRSWQYRVVVGVLDQAGVDLLWGVRPGEWANVKQPGWAQRKRIMWREDFRAWRNAAEWFLVPPPEAAERAGDTRFTLEECCEVLNQHGFACHPDHARRWARNVLRYIRDEPDCTLEQYLRDKRVAHDPRARPQGYGEEVVATLVHRATNKLRRKQPTHLRRV